jgi:hypothetical protein
MLLQIPDFRLKFVSNSDITKRYFEIEHYFSNEVLVKNNIIKEDETLSDEIFEI